MTLGDLIRLSPLAPQDSHVIALEAITRAVSHDGHFAEFGHGCPVMLATILRLKNNRLRLHVFEINKERFMSLPETLGRQRNLCVLHHDLVPQNRTLFTKVTRLSFAHVVQRHPLQLKIILKALLPIMSFGGTIMVSHWNDPDVQQTVTRYLASKGNRDDWRVMDHQGGLATIFQQKGRA